MRYKKIIRWIIPLLLLFFIYRFSTRFQEDFANSDFYIDNSTQDYIDANNSVNQRTKRCNAYFQKNSFCQWDTNANKCACKYQKDDVKYPFPSPSNCCNRQCSLLSKEECLGSKNGSSLLYYCNIGGVCMPRQATIRDNRISANNCGTDALNNQLLLPFVTKEECERSTDVCDIYNDERLSETEKKKSCLADIRCGYCTNKNNVGKCIGGTATGPNDLQKYYYCQPSRVRDGFEYMYGDHATALNISEITERKAPSIDL